MITKFQPIVRGALALALAIPAAAPGAELAGLILPYREAVLSAQLVGRVAQIHFKDGDAVRENEIILELDKRAEEIEAERRKIVWEVKAELQSSEARVKTLKRDYESTKSVEEKTKSVSKDELAKKALELRIAELELDQITHREEIEKLEYEFAVEQVRRREIRAPHGGQIVEIVPKVGEVCEPRQPLVRFVDASKCYFVGNLDSASGVELKVSQRMSITVSTGTGSIPVEGVVEFVAPVIDAATGLRRVKLIIENSDGRVTPGSQATLSLPPSK